MKKEAKFETVNQLEFDSERESGTVHLKVGNVVTKIDFRMTYDGEVETTLGKELRNLVDAGMEFDFSDLEKEFRAQHEAHEEKKLQAKREEAQRRWENSWVHKVEKPKTNKPVEFVIPTEEDYVEKALKSPYQFNRGPSFMVIYRGFKVSITRDRNRKGTRFQVSDSITDYKTRSYATPENALGKIVKLVDKEIASKRAQQKQELEAQRKREAKLARLKAEFGDLGEIKMESSYRSSRHGNGFYLYKTYLVWDEEEVALDENYSEDELFDLGSFSKLTATQVREIITVLKKKS